MWKQSAYPSYGPASVCGLCQGRGKWQACKFQFRFREDLVGFRAFVPDNLRVGGFFVALIKASPDVGLFVLNCMS